MTAPFAGNPSLQHAHIVEQVAPPKFFLDDAMQEVTLPRLSARLGTAMSHGSNQPSGKPAIVLKRRINDARRDQQPTAIEFISNPVPPCSITTPAPFGGPPGA